MARHRTAEEKRELAERARAMRAAGRSRREIQAELHIGEDLAKAFLRGVPLPDSLSRPRAKDDLRQQAVQLREQGASYDEIAAALGISKSSCSLWLRHLPRPERDPERAAAAVEQRVTALRARMRRDREERDEAGREARAAVARALGVITARDLLLALAVSYWCEGAKSKPWNRQKQVRWMNSDPVLVSLFLEALDLIGIERERVVLRVHIHENADEEAARAWWAEQTGVPLQQFMRSTIKRHKPQTVRQNTGPGYHGCLCVCVRQGRTLYEVVNGLVEGLATMPRQIEEWHDDLNVGGTQPPDITPSALV